MKFVLPLTFLFTLLWSTSGFSQTFLSGKLTDQDTGEELIYANVIVYKKGIFYTKTTTDFEGNYKVQIIPGEFDVEFHYLGYSIRKIIGVVVKEGADFKLDHQLSSDNVITICCPHVVEYLIPLFEKEASTPGTTIISNQIRENTGKKINDLIINTPGVTTLRF